MKKNNLPSAAEHTQSLLAKTAQDSKDAELFISVGESLLRENKLDEAVKCYARAAELEPSSHFRSLYWEWLGTIMQERNQTNKAIQAFAKWAENDPISCKPIDRWGTVLASEAMWTDLLLLRSHYKKRLELSSDIRILESMALYAFIMEQLGSEEDPSPMELACTALETKYDSITMRFLLGLIYFRAGHLEGAIAEFTKVITLDEERNWKETRFALNWTSGGALLMLGRLARLQHRYSQAVEYFQKCFDKDINMDDNLEPLEELASMLIETGAYKEALDILPAGPQIDEVLPWVKRLRGKCLLGLGYIRQAARTLIDPTEEKPESSDQQELSDNQFMRNLAQANAYLESSCYSQALDMFNTLLEEHPDSPECLLGSSRALGELGRPEEAINTLEGLVISHPDSINIWRQLGSLYKKQGDITNYRLCRIQIQSMPSASQMGDKISEWIAPALPDCGSPGLGISARALPGEGQLTITGLAGTEAIVNIAWTYLRAEANRLNISTSGNDIHVHVRDLNTETRFSLTSGSLPTLTPSADVQIFGEDIGLAVLMAMASALSGNLPRGVNVVAGRIDLSGNLFSSPSLVVGLTRLLEGGLNYSRIILPRAITVDLDRLPQSIWTSADVVLCSSAAQAITTMNE